MMAKEGTFIVTSFFLLIFCVIGAFWMGHYTLELNDYLEVLKYWLGFDLSEFGEIKSSAIILQEIRLPRILAAISIGASLSVSGAVFQGIFVNPLVSPGILGVLSGASFGAAVGMLFGQSLLFIQMSAFVFGFAAVFFALVIGRFYGQSNTLLMLVLGGVISSSLFGALLSLVKYMADPYGALPSIVYWLMGSLSSVNLPTVLTVVPWMFISIIILIFFGKHLNVMSLGEDEAKALGVDVKKIRFMMVLLATLLGALSVMLAGVIGWVGLVVPHIARFIIGANHIALLPFSAILGGIFLLIVDTASRSAFATEIPLGILTSLVGIPIFIVVLRHSVRR
jgi:iron complex transport system permease protein